MPAAQLETEGKNAKLQYKTPTEDPISLPSPQIQTLQLEGKTETIHQKNKDPGKCYLKQICPQGWDWLQWP